MEDGSREESERKLEEVRVERKCHPWPWAKSLAGTKAAERTWTWGPVLESELVISYRGYQLSLTGFLILI